MSIAGENTQAPLSAADVAAVINRNNGNGGWGGFGMGGGIGELLIAMIMLFLFPMFFGGGMFGGMGGWGNGGMMAAANGALTRADLCAEFNFNGLENAVRGVQQGLCDGFYAMQNSINGLGMNVMQGFHGVDNAVCQLGYQTQQGFTNTQIAMMQGQNAIQTQMSDCCCKNQTGQMQLGSQMERGFCDVNYAQATNTNQILQSTHNDADRILAHVDARFDALERNQDRQKIAEQAAEIQTYKQNAAFSAMIDASRAEILRRSGHDCPTAAYIVQPPQPVSFATNCSGQATFNNGWGNSCGGYNNSCGSCC